MPHCARRLVDLQSQDFSRTRETARTIGSWNRANNSRFALRRLLLVVDENLFVIGFVVREGSTVS